MRRALQALQGHQDEFQLPSRGVGFIRPRSGIQIQVIRVEEAGTESGERMKQTRTKEFTSTWKPPSDVRSALRRGERAWKAFQKTGSLPSAAPTNPTDNTGPRFE